MVNLWVVRIQRGLSSIEDVPPIYLDAVKKELGIE